MARTAPPETWGHSTVRTACPLDCPDACTLDVTVENGRIQKIDGGDDNPVTRNFICAKVRRFDERVYGEDRVLYPSVRQGAKGQGTYVARHLGRGARPDRAADAGDQGHGTAPRRSCPTTTAARTACSRRTPTTPSCGAGSARRAWPPRSAPRRPARRASRSTARCRRRLPGLSAREADHPVGRQPVGVRHPPHPLHQGSAGRRRDARRDRSAHDVAREEGRPAPRRAARAPTCRSRSRCTA